MLGGSGVQAFRPGSGIHRMDRISGIGRRSDAGDERLQDTKREGGLGGDRTASKEEDRLLFEFVLPWVLSSSMNPFRIYALDLHSICAGVGRKKALRLQLWRHFARPEAIVCAIAYFSANIFGYGLVRAHGGKTGAVPALGADQEIKRAGAEFGKTFQ